MTRAKKAPQISRSVAGSLGDRVFPYAMIGPAVVLFIAFTIYPFIFGFIVSFHKWDGMSDMKWLGLRNYINVLKDVDFWLAMKNTMIYAICVTVLKNVIAVLLALILVRDHFPGRSLFRTATYLPVTLSYVVIGILWKWIYNPEFGLLNPFLEMIGCGNLIRGWLSDRDVALYSVIFVDIWKWVGFHTVMYMAGLNAISKDYYEAAALDGASGWQRFWHITFPQLNSSVFTNILMSMNGAMTANYALVNTMTGGGPNGATEVAATMIIKTGLKYVKLGEANAMTFVVFLFTVALGFIQLKTISHEENYE